MARIKTMRMVVFPGNSNPTPIEHWEEIPHTCTPSDKMRVNLDCAACMAELREETEVKPDAEETGEGTEGGSGEQELEPGAEGRLRLRDDAENGLDASASESSDGDAEEEKLNDLAEDYDLPEK